MDLISQKLYTDVKSIIDEGVLAANVSTDGIALLTYWRVGKRIAEEIKGGEARADYGMQVIANLAEQMKLDYAGHYSKRNLDYYCQFYRSFPDFEIVNTRVHNLHWSHYRHHKGLTLSPPAASRQSEKSEDNTIQFQSV